MAEVPSLFQGGNVQMNIRAVHGLDMKPHTHHPHAEEMLLNLSISARMRALPTLVDVHSKEARSANMARVRGRDTKPEMVVRRLLHKLGYRFRLCRKDLPGRPDIVLARWNVAIFVHGCFWHQHNGCSKAARPATNREFWSAKLDRNIERDEENRKALTELGWRIFTVWECRVGDTATLADDLERFIRSDRATEQERR